MAHQAGEPYSRCVGCSKVISDREQASTSCIPPCRIIAWEVTRRCNLACVHCRASAKDIPYSRELNKAEALNLIRNFNELGRPLVIFTGGEPLLRPDLFELIRAVRENGQKVALSTNGTLISPAVIAEIKALEVSRCSISIDGASSAAHDGFRGVPGAFELALKGVRQFRCADIPVQINTTITYENFQELPAIFELCKQLGVAAWHVFLLVPVGRGTVLQSISPSVYEQALVWIYKQSQTTEIEIKPTCAPQYNRLLSQKATGGRVGRGCLGGMGFCFISHTGMVQPCGYLQLNCGNVREMPLSEIWRNAPVFRQIRDVSAYSGPCGKCRFRHQCGGCRARAYAYSGDYLSSDPICPCLPS